LAIGHAIPGLSRAASRHTLAAIDLRLPASMC